MILNYFHDQMFFINNKKLTFQDLNKAKYFLYCVPEEKD